MLKRIFSPMVWERCQCLLGKSLYTWKRLERYPRTFYISREPREDYLNLPSHAECLESKDTFTEHFHQFYFNYPITAKGLCQKCDDRYLIQNPPSMTYTEEEMDAIYSMEFARDVHPYYKAMEQ